MADLKPCPLCGALPCDWVDDPHKAEVGLCWTLAKIREVLGVGEKPMLGELPDIIAATLTAQAAEIARLKARLNWLANETMACDYGDNDHGAVSWNFHTYRGVKTSIIGASIDAAIDAALTGSQSHD